MHSSTLFFTLFLLAVLTFTSAQQPEEALACYQPSCTPLISLLQECKISVDPTTGNINFPVEVNTTATTDKCLCTQKIVNAYDPCYTCGAENKKIQTRFSTQSLVDSCNLNFGALTVSMPGTSSPASRGSNVLSSSVLGVLVVLGSVFVMA
ncbi:hypothetical protein BG015_011212 [Linnemannia schmuckeri]|uniref:Uncharacterized protein n=1 Tax=Linnemannia schmuckeri TaxID=64567 RepID=A0A9P5RVP6_9FUNG|nr:hypothetical protein BG015_011212 [Linnemannia schmuckeri]